MASTESRGRRAALPGGSPTPRAKAGAKPASHAGAILEIDLDAIAENFVKLAERVGPAVRVAAVVKADAYGLGMEKVAPALARAGAKTFFVATLEEGLALRQLLPRAQIAVLNGLVMGAPADFAKAALLPVLNDLGQVASWQGYAARRRRCSISIPAWRVWAFRPRRRSGLSASRKGSRASRSP